MLVGHLNSKKSKKVKMPSQCVECNITYKDPKSLTRHQKTKHGDVLQFNCEKCPFTSNRKDNLMRHLGVHEIRGETSKPHLIDVDELRKTLIERTYKYNGKVALGEQVYKILGEGEVKQEALPKDMQEALELYEKENNDFNL